MDTVNCIPSDTTIQNNNQKINENNTSFFAQQQEEPTTSSDSLPLFNTFTGERRLKTYENFHRILMGWIFSNNFTGLKCLTCIILSRQSKLLVKIPKVFHSYKCMNAFRGQKGAVSKDAYTIFFQGSCWILSEMGGDNLLLFSWLTGLTIEECKEILTSSCFQSHLVSFLVSKKALLVNCN